MAKNRQQYGINSLRLGFTTRVCPNLKTRVTQTFFQPETRVSIKMCVRRLMAAVVMFYALIFNRFKVFLSVVDSQILYSSIRL